MNRNTAKEYEEYVEYEVYGESAHRSEGDVIKTSSRHSYNNGAYTEVSTMGGMRWSSDTNC
jgi:hypothetical protein